MTTIDAQKTTVEGPLQPEVTGPVATWFADGWTVTWRNLSKVKRSPDVLVFAILQPIMFVLLFSQVFGGAIGGGNADFDYTNFLMAGIFAQTVVFGSTFSGAAMAQDLKEGLIDRFRTLPMNPSAVLVGRTNSDLVLNTLSMIIMILTGFAIGWRFESGFLSFFGGVVLLMLFSYSFSWVMALLGMMVKSPETINNASFMILFPITFISNAFVPAESLPRVLEVFANWNPVSALIQGARELFGNTGGTIAADTWPMQNPIITAVAGSLVLLIIFVPLAIKKFANTSSR
ncbi:ABC transporter permease [Ornithinimicrobium sp. INDO-MA30-4]|uniref:ABC transporter permease n=1 Tax=Ornithinimicrobium sp. INDO-MA30-4 TaxID=2908651 RepID=UPI001F463B46|nr:ABC transporter permease [Ornithinimicrobium sp. INDO-MA30-4]UJH69422.1 ABC transporter permease [Ornithinimicrobium sp. INDO-MA30-4]